MLINIEVPAWTVTGPTVCGMQTDIPGARQFPIFMLDKGSYITGGKIYSGINFNWEAGIHSIQVGRYSSCAEDVLFMINVDHDYRSVYQGCIPAIKGDGLDVQFRKLRRKGQIIVQNDCWIGHGVTIMNGVTIHNGAVVGAMATVTKDVPPYAIVAGNPAQIVGYRFEKETIDKLLKIAWWDWSDEKIRQNEKLLKGDVEEFVRAMLPEVHATVHNPVRRLTHGKLFVYYLDMEQPFPLWRRVIQEFISKFEGTKQELLLYLDPLVPEAFRYGEELLQMLDDYKDSECYINIYSETLEDDLVLLHEADYYITNRHLRNISRMCAADRSGATCISGLNTDIFLGM